jgi:hypothetical protein
MDLSQLQGRLDVLRTLVRVHRLLSHMARLLPEVPSRFSLFVPHPTRPGTSVEFLGDAVIKRITDWPVFARTHCTSLEEVNLVSSLLHHTVACADQRTGLQPV